MEVAFANKAVEQSFLNFKPSVKPGLLRLRDLIFEVANNHEQVGQLEETLKWGQPSYLTVKPKSGTTIRLDKIDADQATYGFFVHCQTSLIETYQDLFGELLSYNGKRGVILVAGQEPEDDILRHCFSLALTYHLKSR